MFGLSCRSTLPAHRPCGAGGPYETETPGELIARSVSHADSTLASGHGALILRLVDQWIDRPAANAMVRLVHYWARDREVAPADLQTPDTDGIHTFVPIQAGRYIVRIAYIGSPVQTLEHDVRSGIVDTLVVKALKGAMCLSHRAASIPPAA